MKQTIWKGLSLSVVVAMALAACAPAATPTPEPTAPPAEEPTEVPAPAEEPTEAPAEVPTEAPAAATLEGIDAPAGSFLARALAGEFTGTTVTASGPFVDADAENFDASIAAFEAATGIDIQYQGSKEFEAVIRTRVDAGDAPDLVDFPQPGLLATFVAQGSVIDISAALEEVNASERYNQSWLDMATMQGPDGPIVAGVWQRVNGKSLVWYPKAAWDEAEYPIPTTWEEMQSLMDTMVAEGVTPWCFGVESGAATGWAATDWTEEMMLRTTTLENYDAWVAGDLPFASPEVQTAVEAWSFLLDDQYVFGGRDSVAVTNFGDAPLPMFQDPPQCYMHKQGNFITSFFPEGTVAGEDFDFFYLPGVDPAYGSPVLVAGDIWAAFSDRPEVMAVVQFFSYGANLKVWMERGGAISPHNDADLAWYGSEIERKIGEIIVNATAVRFDGSDLMPGAVGAGTFWTEMTAYVSGGKELLPALEAIDASWPR